MHMTDVTADAIVELAAQGESQTVEFKTSFPPDHTISKILTAFANTQGGILLIGICDNGEIVGLSQDEADNAVNRLQKIAASLFPWGIDEVGSVTIGGKKIVYAIIEQAPDYYSPVMTSSGDIYKRESNRIVYVPSDERLEPSIRSKISHIKPMETAIAFVAMSFRDEEEPALVDYFKAMERAAEQTNLPIDIVRVDLVEGDYEISQEIMNEIDKADIVIADFTMSSRNVYFELGYARGKDKYVIQTARNGTQLEFDIRNWRTLFYRNATELEEKLIPALEAAYAEIKARG
jgi:hypothetical protein